MIDPYRRRRSQGPSVAPREKARLWVLGILFVLVLAAFLGFRLVGTKPTEEGTEQDDGVIDTAPPVDQEGRAIHTVVPPRPEEVRDRAEAELRSKLDQFRREGKLQDAAPGDDTEVLEYLVNAGMWNYRVTGTPTDAYRTLDPVEVAFEPGPHRGSFVSAWGPVVEVYEPVPFPDRINGVEKIYSASFRTEEGQLYRVASPLPIVAEPGKWIQVYGIFYRLREITVGEEKETAFCLVHVTDHEIAEAFPPIAVTEIDPQWAAEVREDTYDEAHSLNERPFWLIMNYARNLGAEGYEALRKSDEFAIEHFGRSAKRLVQEASLHRFRFVSAEGRIVATSFQELSSDNPGKIERMDGAFLIQPSEYIVRLISPRRWSEYDLDFETAHVRVEGIFYKQYQYFPQKGPPALVVPALIVTGVYPQEEVQSSILKVVMYAIAGLAVAVVAFFFFMAFRDRRGYNEFRRGYLEKRRRREEGSPEEDGPAGS
jgi:hypothetical protein